MLDNKQECYKIFCDGVLIEDYQASSLTQTWAPSALLEGLDIQYAQIWCGGNTLSQVCPAELSSRWQDVNKKAMAFLKSFHATKINLEDVCFYDLIPEKFLMDFYGIKNEITSHVFETYKKPKNYDFLRDLIFFIKKIQDKPIKFEASGLDYSSKSTRSAMAKLKNKNRKILYNPWKAVTGRLTTETGSFPILTLNKDLRGLIKPHNDLFVELDFNSAELRVLLGLLGQDQPSQDIHSWIAKEVFEGKFEREDVKKKVFAWLYNPNAKNKKLNEFLNRDKIYETYFLDDSVMTPYYRNISVKKDKAVSYLIQSTASDMLLTAAMKIDEILKNKKSFVSFCIHDSVILDMSAEDKELINSIQSAFSNTMFGNLKTNLSMGKNFGAMRRLL